MPKFAKGEDPVASLPNPEAANADEDVCGRVLAEDLGSAASSVAIGKSVVDEEFCP